MGKFTFTQAVRTARGARIALAGPSGSGKTFTALTLATAMGTKVLGADTESKTMSLYADLFRFDKVELDNYDPRDLIELFAEAAAARYDAVVVDSWSHFWSGEAGMLDLVDAMSRGKSGSTFNNGWKAVTPIERDMIKAIKSYPGHVIVTMRTKTEWVIGTNDRGQQAPQKIGLKPDQRADFEYEFDVFATLDRENTLTVEKTRCSLLSGGVYRKPTGEIGVTLRDWLESGASAPNAQDIRDQALADGVTVDGLFGLYEQARDAGLLGASVLTAEGQALPLNVLLLTRRDALTSMSAPVQAVNGPRPVPAQQRPAAPYPTGPDGWPVLPESDDVNLWKGYVAAVARKVNPARYADPADPNRVLPGPLADDYAAYTKTQGAPDGLLLKHAGPDDLAGFAVHIKNTAPVQSNGHTPTGVAA